MQVIYREVSMCQLLAMNSSKPAGLGFSFAGFAERGGRTGEHKDGWGIAYHTGAGCQLVTDHLPATLSPRAARVTSHPVKANTVLAHIRKATQGRVAPENSHPFVRELWGSSWSFAHNGDLTACPAPPCGSYAALGETDSERAFCHLLAGLRQRYPQRPCRSVLYAALLDLAREIGAHGSFNFLLSDGDALYAHCSTQLFYVLREYPFAEARLIDRELSIDFRRHNHLDDRIAVVATAPLTSNEAWTAFAPGELKVFTGGRLVDGSVAPRTPVFQFC